ncbi:hypothetical protein G9C98_002217 [Cotesia typhae]|uniref:Uncharacterized protein n=1 Tax=Cotesia typhae TaxID=2053667 RepID=A0A8J5RJG2_9HYME|nr:hypothetical protein G9C98_002217 [Cotesia typhae]
MEELEQLEYVPEDVIVISDQQTLIETLVKNLEILRAEIRHCNLIDSKFEKNLEFFKENNNYLITNLQSLSSLAEQQLNMEIKNKMTEFVKHIYQSWEFNNKQISDEYATYSVASRTAYGVALTSLLYEIKNQVSTAEISLQLGESLYDQEYLVKGHIYCSELNKLLSLLKGCDEKVQQYLMISKMNYNLQQLKNLIEEFSLTNNLLSYNYSDNDSKVFQFLYQLLTGELLGWEPVNPEFILKENAPKKPVFITRNNHRGSQLKRLQHLPLFN